MDILPAASSIPQTSAIDALRRVHSSAAADDSEDSQTGGYLFGDGKENPHGSESYEDEPAEPIQDAVELSPTVMADHPDAGLKPDLAEPGESQEEAGHTGSSPDVDPERHVDIEA